MSETAELKTLTSEEITTITRQTNYGTWRFQKTWKPLHIADAEGCWFTDGAGKRYLDFSSQLMCVNLGHKNPRVWSRSPSRRASWPMSRPATRRMRARG
jgi:taurine--2-oxoglutarate transaminase